MRLSEAVRVLVLGEAGNMPVLTHNDLRCLFPRDGDASLKAGIKRLIGIGLLSRAAPKVYLNHMVNLGRPDIAGRVANCIRPHSLNYLSYESALRYHDMIDQIPHISTFATTGRNGEFKTSAGTIQFTHTPVPAVEIMAETEYVSDRHCLMASPRLTLKDTRRARPEVVLAYVSDEDRKDAEREWNARRKAA